MAFLTLAASCALTFFGAMTLFLLTLETFPALVLLALAADLFFALTFSPPWAILSSSSGGDVGKIPNFGLEEKIFGSSCLSVVVHEEGK